MPDLERLAPVADEKQGVAGDSALMHAERADLADEGVDHDFENVREDVHFRIRLAADRCRFRAFAFQKLRRVALGRVRHQLDDDIEQLGHAGAAARGHEAHRDQVPVAQRLLERRVQLLGTHLALLEVLGHQLLVDLDHLVDQRAMRFLDRGKIRFAGGVEKAVDDTLAPVRRQVDRQAFLAERPLDPGEQPRQVDVFRVDLVDDDHAAQAALRGPLHHAAGDHFDAVLGIDHDRRGFDRRQRANGAADEIG